MIFKLLAQTVLAVSLLQLFPYDAGVVERHATLPASTERRSIALTQAFSLLNRPLPRAGDAVRGPIKVVPTSIGVVTSAVSAMVVDRETGTTLFEKNNGVSRSIGSITKLMTAFVFLEGQPDLLAKASLQAEDMRPGGVQHLRMGDEVTVHDLLSASLVGSDNSATAALVRLSGLSLGDFVARMNEAAADIGMQQTTFVDSTGLSFENRSVASDIVKLLDVTMKNVVIREATELAKTSITGSSGRVYAIESTNELLAGFLNKPPYKIVGGKTGFLPEAGYCFGAVVSEDGAHEIIVVVLGSESKHGRFQDAKALAAWTFNVFNWPDEI